MTILDALGTLILLLFLLAISPLILIAAIIYGIVLGIQNARSPR